jgi:hypothetical protein
VVRMQSKQNIALGLLVFVFSKGRGRGQKMGGLQFVTIAVRYLGPLLLG